MASKVAEKRSGPLPATAGVADVPVEEPREPTEAERAAQIAKVANEATWYACRLGDFKTFYEQLRLNPVLINSRDAEGHSALHWFALNNDKDAVQKLLSLGAEVNARSDNLQTPFMWAIVKGHINICLLLLENGADIDTRDSLGATPLILSVQHAQHLLFLLLLDMGADPEVGDVRGAAPAHWAAYKGDFTAMRILVRRGIDLHKYDAEGMTVFHRACRGGQSSMAKYLLEKHDFDVAAKSKDMPGKPGQTGADMARYLGHENVLRVCAVYEMQRHAIRSASSIGRMWMKFKKNYVKQDMFGTYYLKAYWLFSFLSCLYVYYANLLEYTAYYTTATMLFFFVCASMLFVFYRLTTGDPGYIDPYGVIGNVRGKAVVESFQRRYRNARRSADTAVDVDGGGAGGGGVGSGSGSGAGAGSGSGSGSGSSPSGGRTRPKGVAQRLLEDTADVIDPEERKELICYSCEIVKPLRSKHCPLCDRCSHRFDHHCVWVGICVSQHNHRLFMLWALQQIVTSVLYLWFMFIGTGPMYNHSRSIGGFLITFIFGHPALLWAWVMNVLALLFGLYIIRGHYKQIARNVTTNELFNLQRYLHFWTVVLRNGRPCKVYENPFDQGSSTNNVMEFAGLREPKKLSRTYLRKRLRDAGLRIAAQSLDLQRKYAEQQGEGVPGREEIALSGNQDTMAALMNMNERDQQRTMRTLLLGQQGLGSPFGNACCEGGHGHGGGGGGHSHGGGGGGGHSHGGGGGGGHSH